MFDVRRRLGAAQEKLEKPSTDELIGNIELAPGSSADSWVELAPSRNSLCSSIEACVLEEKMDKDSRLSPVSTHSPMVEFDSLEQVKYKLIQDMLPPGTHTDWIWDWSSRPESLPFKSQRLKHGSNLTTPPNSPEPPFAMAPFDVDQPMYSFRVVVGFVLSNIVTFVLGATVGFAVCKKFVKHRQL